MTPEVISAFICIAGFIIYTEGRLWLRRRKNRAIIKRFTQPAEAFAVAEGHCNTSARCDMVVVRRVGSIMRADIVTGIECLGSPRSQVYKWRWVFDVIPGKSVRFQDCTHEENVAITAGYWSLMEKGGERYGMNYDGLIKMRNELNAGSMG